MARDEVVTAGAPEGLRLTPDKRTIRADGTSLAFVTADVVDRAGNVVPGAVNPITFTVHNGRLVGLDNGRQESAENYKSDTRMAWAGKALAIVQSSDRAGPVTITATSPGLRAGRTTVRAASSGRDRSDATAPAADVSTVDTPVVDSPTADASYSGAPNTLPAAMLDGNTASGGWSNFYRKSATALLPTVSAAHQQDWVSVSWPHAQALSTATAYFTTDAARALPAAVQVSYWDGRTFRPARNVRITWATASNQSTAITFDPVRTTRIRLVLTSVAPNTPTGFIQIAELHAAA